MFTRVVTFAGTTDVDAGVRYLQDTVASLLREQRGFRGSPTGLAMCWGSFAVGDRGGPEGRREDDDQGPRGRAADHRR